MRRLSRSFVRRKHPMPVHNLVGCINSLAAYPHTFPSASTLYRKGALAKCLPCSAM